MSDFERWFEDQDFYTNMRFIHGDKLFDKDGDVYRVLPVQMVYQGWNTQRQRSKDEFVELTQEWHTKGWNARQGEIDELKAQLNNMETCYIEKKKEVEACSALVGQWREKRMGGCSDYARGGLHSRQDCTDDLEKALRGANA